MVGERAPHARSRAALWSVRLLVAALGARRRRTRPHTHTVTVRRTEKMLFSVSVMITSIV